MTETGLITRLRRGELYMVKERILCYGGAGTGKSFAWLSLAKEYSHSKFYVIDTDSSADRMLPPQP